VNQKEWIENHEFSRAVGSNNPDPNLPLGWFAISHRFMTDSEGHYDKKKCRRAHGKWFQISSEKGRVFRVLRFNPSLQSAQEPSKIIIDYEGWLKLIDYGDDADKPIKLTIQPARWFRQCLLIAVSNPDPLSRLASWVSVVSLGLGILALVLALWPLFKT